MAFDGLSDKLQGVIKKLKGRGKISETELKEVLREVRIALLEADVNFKVVKDFVKNVNEKALGQEVLESLTQGQMIIKL
jgi:signal recognition particle subunit SRP54